MVLEGHTSYRCSSANTNFEKFYAISFIGEVYRVLPLPIPAFGAEARYLGGFALRIRESFMCV